MWRDTSLNVNKFSCKYIKLSQVGYLFDIPQLMIIATFHKLLQAKVLLNTCPTLIVNLISLSLSILFSFFMPLTSMWCSVFKCRSHLMAHFACFVLIKTVDRQCQLATQHYHPYAHPSLLPILTEHTHTNTMERSWLRVLVHHLCHFVFYFCARSF